MQINRVTLTGADDMIQHRDLLELQQSFPFVEWGILFSESKEGARRYPSKNWIFESTEWGLNLSAHLCGKYTRSIIEDSDLFMLMALPNEFKRVQLNYNFYYGPESVVDNVVKACESVKQDIIVQYNKSNHKAVAALLSKPRIKNLHILNDASGGRGKQITSITIPFEYYTGYSGGIDDKNIENVCKIISISDGLNEGPVWIDMESGVRTDDKFDLDKAKRILEVASKYVV